MKMGFFKSNPSTFKFSDNWYLLVEYLAKGASDLFYQMAKKYKLNLKEFLE